MYWSEEPTKQQQQELSQKSLPTKSSCEEIMWVCEFILAGIPSHADFALSQDTSGQKVLL